MKNTRVTLFTAGLLFAALLLASCHDDSTVQDGSLDIGTGTIETVTTAETSAETQRTVVPEPLFYLDFSNAEANFGFAFENDMTHAFSEKGVTFTATGGDPYIHLQCPEGNTKALAYAVIVYQTDLSSDIRGEFYASRADGVNMGENGSHVEFFWGEDTHADGEFLVQTVPLDAWSDDDTALTGFRLDPMAGDITAGDSVTIRALAIVSTEAEANAFTVEAYEAHLREQLAAAEAEEAARLEALKHAFAQPEYREIDISARDNTPGTLSMTPADDGRNMIISYQLDGETRSYTVPNQNQYLSGPFAGTDDLGRSLYTQDDEVQLYASLDEMHPVDVWGSHGEHAVGLFYFLWMGEHGDQGIRNMTEILAKEGSDSPDFEDWGPVGSWHYFAEPLYGYYYSSDEWVVRKHMELLSNAGVDFLYFDVTNGFAYIENAKLVMRVCHEMNEQGYDAPQVVFYTHSNAKGVVQLVYDEIYAQNLYPDTWFCMDGKPLIVAPQSSNIDDFFSIRQDQWPNEDTKKNSWPWMDFTLKQRIFKNRENVGDTISVSVAQHAGTVCFSDSAIYGDRTNRGRSYLPYYEGTSYRGTNDMLDDTSYLYGYNFGAQFARAIRENVKYVLVTGWNEWVAQRQDPNLGGRNNQVVFVDTSSIEYSRDIEMTRGYYFDNYYMQMISNIQALKGAVPDMVQDMRKTINITGDFDQWDDVVVTYTDAKGDTANRDHMGFGQTQYTDQSGRNDIVRAKVTSDNENVYFYVQTAENITAYDNQSAWMQLFLNVDGEETGWYGYDYLIGDTVKDDLTLTVVRITGDKRDQTEAAGEVSMHVKDNEMMVEIPLSILGIPNYKEIVLEFKWADSMNVIDEMEDFYSEGDAAPLGRLNWVYRNTK